MTVIALTMMTEMVTRAARIRTTAGYYTNAGEHVYRGRSQFDARINPDTGQTYDPFPLITLRLPTLTVAERPARERPRPEHKRAYTAAFEVNGVLLYGGNHPQDAAHQLLADLWRAIDLNPPWPADDMRNSPGIEQLVPGDATIGDPDPETTVVVVTQIYTTVFFQQFGDY